MVIAIPSNCQSSEFGYVMSTGYATVNCVLPEVVKYIWPFQREINRPDRTRAKGFNNCIAILGTLALYW